MLDSVCIVIYFILMFIWVVLLFVGSSRHKAMIDPLERKKYLFKDFYGVGFQLLEILNYSYDSPLDRKRKAQAQIVYGEQYAEYYYRVNMAEKVTYASFCIVIAPLLGPLFKTPVMMVFGLIAAAVLWAYSDSKITDIIKAREEIITKDFCNVVSKMALLFNAGMITREAWQTIAATGQGTLYDEMRNAVDEMENGTSEVDAYINFGNRCGVPFVKKFTSMLVQTIIKGPKDVADFLKKESAVCWEEKKHIVRRQGEAAANKLMIPLGMILIGIFIMILVPVLSKIGM